MERQAERPKKSRSLGTASMDPNASRQPTSTTDAVRRPELGDRHYSAPSSSRRRQSNAKRSSEGSKASDRSRRSSKASSRDDPTARSAGSEHTRNSSFSATSSVKSVDKESLPVLTFAVVGSARVGKSVFIRNALDLRRPASSTLSTSKASLGGRVYRLQLLETDRSFVDFEQGRIVWPRVDEAGGYPDIDGVLCLYDVSNKESLEGLPELLTALDATGIATCLVACKVEIPLCDYEVPQNFPEKVQLKFPGIVSEETSFTTSDSAKRCLLKILKESLAGSGRRSSLPEQPRSGQGVPTVFPPRTSSRNVSRSSSRSRSGSRHQSMHSRSRDNLFTQPPSVIQSESEDDSGDASADEEEDRRREPGFFATRLTVDTANAKSSTQQGRPQTPVSTTIGTGGRITSPSGRTKPPIPDTPDSLIGAAMLRRGSADTSDSQTYRTFLNMDDESIHEEASSANETAEKLRNMTTSDDSPTDGVTFAELVDRLLTLATTKNDQKFVPVFLCLYRAFATPLALLGAIIERFVKTEKSDMVAFTKTAELLRYLSVLGQWTTYYPGDFADAKTRDMANDFVATVGETKSYAAAARQVANNLQIFVPDEDEDWGFKDETKPTRSRGNTISQKSPSAATSSKDSKSRQRTARKLKDEDGSECDDDAPAPSSPRHSAPASSASSLVKPSQVSSQTSDNLHNLERARENARKLRAVPHIPVSKIQWHQLMACTTDELAVEITRIDWTMYSAIRPRDLIRYVTVPSSQRVKAGQVDHIGLMTKHFNHLALFVSGMVLLRDKPKHRARMLGKFMDLAWKVRQMNNYHALGAIVAALNSEEIMRLTQTQELITPEQHKQFLRLKILMGHQKSHAAYRMAWENSSGERIPFLPRIQEDLTKAASGNATFVGGKIKWSKFEVMGDTIIGVQRSQEQPYVFPDRTARGHDIVKLVLETKVLEGDEDCADPQQELYDRSKQVEPLTSGTKKFDWLRR